jgi:hypothetical protein
MGSLVDWNSVELLSCNGGDHKMNTLMIIAACGCLAATTLAAEPMRVLSPNALDRVAAGGCVVGSLCTPRRPPSVIGPGAFSPLSIFPAGLGCPRGSECSSGRSFEVGGEDNFVRRAIPPGRITPIDPQVSGQPITPTDP